MCAIANVMTRSSKWVNETKGSPKVCYWTNGWTPTKKLNEIRVFDAHGIVYVGRVVDVGKMSPYALFMKYSRNPSVIGLSPNESCGDFQRMLCEAFRVKGVPSKLGYIEFYPYSNRQDLPDSIHEIHEKLKKGCRILYDTDDSYSDSDSQLETIPFYDEIKWDRLDIWEDNPIREEEYDDYDEDDYDEDFVKEI